eukprot:scaffold119623_cov21-Cyclotella_meneghiniana.AAC.2
MIFATYPGLDWTKHPSDADEQEDKYNHWDKRSIYVLNNEVTKHYDEYWNDLKCRKKGSDCDLWMMSAVSSTAAKYYNP